MAAALTTLVSFDGPDSSAPEGDLIADSSGGLFGATSSGGANSDGTVFEIKRTAAGYASAPTTLVSFHGSDGAQPFADLLADANGDLFGATSGLGPNGLPFPGDGAVFEIKKTATGYASAPTTLGIFHVDDGENREGSLITDANGDLFGTTSEGGPSDDGTVFEITDSGFVPAIPPISPTLNNDILFQNMSGQAAIWHVSGATLSSSALLGANPGPNWKVIGTGDFNDDTHSDVLLQNVNGHVAVWLTDGTPLLASGLLGANPGPNWKVVGSGDFDGNGDSDILLQNANGNVAKRARSANLEGPWRL
jgi:uncharacterized repeat protein (TIGR03803 family)